MTSTSDGPRASGPPAATARAAAGLSPGSADRLVHEMYRAHAVTLVRVAVLLLGDQASAEDVVQDAFFGLYRALPRLRDRDKALPYLRAAVVNGARSVLHARKRAALRRVLHEPPVWSAESAAMAGEDRRAVLAAVAALPRRSRDPLSQNAIGVINTGTGAVRQWTAPKQQDIDSLSLSADGRLLSYSGGGGNYPFAVGLLHTAAPAGTVAERARIVAAGARLRPPSAIYSDVTAADGKSIYFCTASPDFRPVGSVLYQLDIARGTRSVVHRFSGGRWCGVSLDSSGRFLLVASTTGFTSTALARVDTVTGQVTHLPALGSVNEAEPPAW